MISLDSIFKVTIFAYFGLKVATFYSFLFKVIIFAYFGFRVANFLGLAV